MSDAQAVTGRPNDTPIRDPEPAPLGGNSTFAERRAIRLGQPLPPPQEPQTGGNSTFAERKRPTKAVERDETENKALGRRSARTK